MEISHHKSEQNGDWIKLYRDLLESSLWQAGHKTFRVGLYTMLTARFKEGYDRNVPLQPGQLLRSVMRIAEDCQLRPKTVEGALERLKTDGFITTDTPGGPHKGQRITVCKYQDYQDSSAGGWIKLYRDLIGSKLWSSTDATLRVGLYLMLIANHEERVVRNIQVDSGQCIRSINRIAEDCLISRKAARYARDMLITDGFVSMDKPEGAQYGQRLTICNYVFYQAGIQQQGGHQGTGSPTIGPTQGTTNKNAENEECKNGRQETVQHNAADAPRQGVLFQEDETGCWEKQDIPTREWEPQQYVEAYAKMASTVPGVPPAEPDTIRQAVEKQPCPAWRAQAFLDWKRDVSGTKGLDPVKHPGNMIAEYMEYVIEETAIPHPLIHDGDHPTDIQVIAEPETPVFPSVDWDMSSFDRSIDSIKSNYPDIPDSQWASLKEALQNETDPRWRAQVYARFLCVLFDTLYRAEKNPQDFKAFDDLIGRIRKQDEPHYWYHGVFHQGDSYDMALCAKIDDELHYWSLEDYVTFSMELPFKNFSSLHPAPVRYAWSFKQHNPIRYDAIQDLISALRHAEKPIQNPPKFLQRYVQYAGFDEEEE